MRVKPIVTYGLVAGTLLLPLTADALGLGRLTVESALGQPLSAKIELLPGSKEELDSVVAKVADPALYRQNNLQYQAALSRARITHGARRQWRGLPADFVARVDERAVSRSDGRGELVVGSRGARLHVPARPAGHADRCRPGGTDYPGARRNSGAARATCRHRRCADGACAAPRATGDAYTVKRGDTLSKIAKDYKPETVTIDQMLVALFKSNQGAFEGANMNRLRSGAIITIPSAVDTSSTQPGEASKIVKVQSADWRAYRDRVAGAAPMADEAGGRVAGGKIGTTVQEQDACGASGRRPAEGVERCRRGQGLRRRRVIGCAGRGTQGSAKPHRRSRKDAEGPATRGRTQEPDDGAVANAIRCQQGQGAGGGADVYAAGRDGGGGCEGRSGRKGSGRREVCGGCEGGSGCEGGGGCEGGSGCEGRGGCEGGSGCEGGGGCEGGSGCEGRGRCQGDAGYQGRCACGGATCPGSETARNQGSAGKGRAQGRAQGSAGNVRRLPRQHAVVGDRRRRAGHPCGAGRIDRRRAGARRPSSRTASSRERTSRRTRCSAPRAAAS